MQSSTIDQKHPPITKVVIPIAGYGTRMFPATKAYPKALFPIIDKRDGFCKPVIQIIIEEALEALETDDEEHNNKIKICIVGQPDQRDFILGYFQKDCHEIYKTKDFLKKQIERIEYIGKKITFVEQKTQEGFGHAVLCAKDFVENDPFIVMLGDHVYTSTHPEKKNGVRQMLDVYEKYGCSVTGLSTCKEDELPYNGIVTGVLVEETNYGSKILKLKHTFEKPSVEYAREHLKVENVDLKEDEYLCYFGVDILIPKVFEYLKERYEKKQFTKGELQLRDPMDDIMKNEGMYGIIVKAKRHDTGMPHPYSEAMHIYNQISIENERK